MHSTPAISVEQLREVIIATAADKARAQTDAGRAEAKVAAIEQMSVIASQSSGNELLHELSVYLNQLKRS